MFASTCVQLLQKAILYPILRIIKKIEFGVCMSLKGWKKQKYLQKSLIALLENVS